MENDAPWQSCGESMQGAYGGSGGRKDWDRANALQKDLRAAERQHGHGSPEANAVAAQVASARAAALEAGYQSSFQGDPGLRVDRRGKSR